MLAQIIILNDQPGMMRVHSRPPRFSDLSASTAVSSQPLNLKPQTSMTDHPYLNFTFFFTLVLAAGFALGRIFAAAAIYHLRQQRDDARALLNGTARPSITRAFWNREEVD